MTEVLLVDRADTGVVTLTFNRPESLNSLSVELKEALRDALRDAAADDGCRALLLAGNGRGFCVGQDLREHIEMLGAGGDPMRTVHEHYTPIAEALGGMPKPVVAAVRGPAAGAGAALAFLADFRVGGPGTSFSMSFAGVGLAGDTGISWSLPRLVGLAKATELTLLGTKVDAATAERLGLVTELVATDDEVLSTATALATRLAAGPTVAYGQLKRELATGASGTLHDALVVEAQAQATCGATADHRAATEAFVAKRRPDFHGH